MAYVKPHTIDDPGPIFDWVKSLSQVAASGVDGKARPKRLLLDLDYNKGDVDAFWVVEATNDKGETYIALTTSILEVAIEAYNEI